jgi:hypothetical protein|tara:strand:+ start:616 stop:831 length:216 start_codon:yes stop_codon:yes gene_type:complete
MKLTQQKSDILDPKPSEQGFIVGKYNDPMMYAAVPVGNSNTKLAIVHQGWVIKVCRNRQSAINYINKHKKK